MNLKIANRLASLRKEKGYSQEELADKLNVSRQAVSKWERGEASPDTDNLIALAKLYDISLDELLDINSTKKSNENDDKVISDKGIHIKSKDGEEVHIDKNGIYIKDNEDEIKLNSILINTNEIDEENENENIIVKVINSLIPLIIVIIYLILGGFFSLWHPGWIVFLFIPVLISLVEAIANKKFDNFLFPIFITAIYLIIGFELNSWHPWWVLYLLIPIYYIIANVIDKKVKR